MADIKILGLNDICEIFGCEKQKGRNILKMAFQMKYATKIGRSLYITSVDLEKFLVIIKGRELIV